MNTMERVYKIYNLLNSRGVVSTDAFLQELEISLATFKRDLAFMKNNLNAPIEWDSYEPVSYTHLTLPTNREV